MSTEQLKKRRCKLYLSGLLVAMVVLGWAVLAQAGEAPYRVLRDVEYVPGGHERQKLDLYLPAEANQPDARLPVIVWVHGGAWTGGSKEGCPALRFVQKGYVVASINYRLSQHAPFPAQIHDCKSAIRWLRANAGKYAIDPDRIGAWGGSAGGHLVALLGTATNKESEGDVGGNLEYSSRVQAVCDYFGPADMVGFFGDKSPSDYPLADQAIRQLLGGSLEEKQELAKLASPVYHVSSDDCPFLILHGDRDNIVPIEQSQKLSKKLESAKVPVRLYVVEGSGHGFGGPYIDAMVDAFFDHYVKQYKPQQARPQPRLPEGAKAIKDIQYVPNGHERHKLDLYLPKQDEQAKPLPLIIWVHGGAWMGGSKENCPALRFLEKGYAVASINYRLSQHAIYPAQIQDCKAAVRWLRANAKEHGIDPKRFGAWGASAGGHLVALLATAGDIKEFDVGENPDVSSRVQAVCDFFGPTDFTKMSSFESTMDHDSPNAPEALLVGGPIQQNKDKCRAANPITYVSKDDPPILIVHGDKDPLVPHNQSEIFHDALRQAGVDATFHTVKGGGHGFRDAEVDRMVEEFFDNRLKAGASAK
jgi:acetyl esterase/lipase